MSEMPTTGWDGQTGDRSGASVRTDAVNAFNRTVTTTLTG